MTGVEHQPALPPRFRVPQEVLMRQVGDELVMLHLGNEHYYGLNAVGARLMLLAEAGTTLEDSAEALLAEFDVDREQLEADLHCVISELLAAGLLEAAPPP